MSKNRDAIYKDANGCCIDHLNNHFAQLQDMCSQYGTKAPSFIHRINEGQSIEEALTRGIAKDWEITPTAIKVFDEHYPNYYAIALKFDVDVTTICRHKDSLEQYLASLDLYTYNGNTYRALSDVSLVCGIAESTLRSRLELGWDWERATSEPVRYRKRVSRQYDHLGNEYETLSEMLLFYNITSGAYYRRRGAGWPLERILTTPVNTRSK